MQTLPCGPLFRIISPPSIRKWMGCTLLAMSISLGQAGAARDLSGKELQDRLAQKDSSLMLTIKAIETTVTGGNTKLLTSLLDTEAVLERATMGFEGSETHTVRKIFQEGTKQAWQNNSPVNDYAGTLFRYLRVRTFKNRTGLLFRSENESGSINYYVFIMGEPKEGEYRVRDIYTFGLDEFSSEGLRRTYSHLLASFSNSNDASKYSSVGQKYVDRLQDIANMNRSVRDGKYAQALSIWESLPVEVQRERNVLMMRLDAAERISPEDRVKAMQQWLSCYPDEMGLPLRIADFYMSQSRWEEARSLLGKVIASVGGDSRMQFQLGQVAYNSNRDGNNWVQAAKLDAKKPEAVTKDEVKPAPSN